MRIVIKFLIISYAIHFKIHVSLPLQLCRISKYSSCFSCQQTHPIHLNFRSHMLLAINHTTILLYANFSPIAIVITLIKISHIWSRCILLKFYLPTLFAQVATLKNLPFSIQLLPSLLLFFLPQFGRLLS